MDEQKIIIDDVDVKDCKRRIGKDNYCRYYKRPCAENNYNCIWKKYLRKEQECERLKEINTELDLDLQNARDSYVALDLMRVGEYNALVDDYNKLKQTLAEIKEIAKAESYLSPQSTRLLVHNILQKISEVENGTNP